MTEATPYDEVRDRKNMKTPGTGSVTSRARAIAWAVTAGLAIAALAVAVPVTLSGVAADTPSGTLADGSSWGPTLGAEVQRAPELAADGTGLARSLAISPSAGLAYLAGWDGVRIVDVTALGRVSFAPVDSLTSTAIALSPDGTRAYLTGGSGGDSSGELIAMSVNGDQLTEEYRTPLPGPGNMGEQAAVSSDGARLYIADMNTGFWVLSTADGQALEAVPFGGMATTIAVNPVDGTVLVDAPMQDSIVLMDPTGTRELHRLVSESGLPDAMAFSPDGQIFAVGENEVVSLYDADGTLRERVELSADIADLVFSPDSTEVAVLTAWSENSWGASEREGIRLIDVSSAQELVRIPLDSTYILGNLAYTGNPGELLTFSSDGLVRIDLGASRTAWGGYFALFAVLALIVLASAVLASTIARWQPALAASRERSRQETARRQDEATSRAAVAQAQRVAADAAAVQQQSAAEHADRVRQMQQWGDAYREANGGQEPPAGFLPMAVPVTPSAPARTGTNIMSILALIFGIIGGGILSIIFGHIALSQIRRTGESGRGLAIAGLILGYLGIAVMIIAMIVLLVVAGSVGVRF